MEFILPVPHPINSSGHNIFKATVYIGLHKNPSPAGDIPLSVLAGPRRPNYTTRSRRTKYL
ncbi:hypothetical protein SAMN05421766_102206 [Zobellia uliginosa]|uniref:Uncharacterized protein n=1 Tax=Zobellia uliginosa TaxID=143224 RepID=A0ABY1KLQ4_9FLAO|nr:hypothetical protein SAMN05421766_102206 [Zobellia uliginosa]